MDNKNEIKVYTTSNGAELNISAPFTKQVISATNNRAQYFAEQAKKYRDEAKLHRDNAKYYAEQNSDVTFEYIDSIRAALEDKIATKQDNGNYALKEELPVNVSELENDAEYVVKTEFDTVTQELELPSQEGCSGKFLMSDGENESWVGLNSFQIFDTKLSDRVLSFEESQGWSLQGTYVYKEALAGIRYGYPDFYNKCIEEKEQATATEVTLGEHIITMHVNSNGHRFYDIADKEAVDSWFNTNGYAWFYGIDIENERIFLPRNKWFEQLTGNISETGLAVNAGLPNIKGSVNEVSCWYDFTSSGVFSAVDSGQNGNHTGNAPHINLSFDASRSSSIYGKSDTVQPNAVKKLLYICVGNTINYEGIVDVVNNGMDILEQVNTGLLSKADKTEVDGQWVHKELGLVGAKLTMGTYTYDLSSYLPNDGFDYEVMFELYVNSAQTTYFVVKTPAGFFMKGTTTAEGATVTLFSILPIDTNRQVIAEVTNTDVKGWSTLHARGYRRIGTNL